MRTRHSINKDLVHKCGFYTEKRVLNTAFTRVQSLIITAAHPLSLITRGNMNCRLFWASYLSQSLSDEECDQLRKEFVKECQISQAAGHCQSNKASRTLIKEELRKPGNEEYYDQILDELANQSDVKNKPDNSALENFLTNGVRNVTDSSTVISDTLSDIHSLISLTSANVDTPVHRTSIFVPGLHSPYNSDFSLGHKQFLTIIIKRRGESGYALVLDPSSPNDIWLPDSTALNRSLRGDTVVIDKFTEKKGTVIANLSDHPKKYFVCYSDRRNRSLFVPIDKQYPKIASLQNVKEDGLRIYHTHVDGMKRTKNYFTIIYQDIEKHVYLVWLNSSWVENYVYPKGVPVKCFNLESDSDLLTSKENDKPLLESINILKYNYIPAMLSDSGKIPTEVVKEAKQKFPEGWKIPNEERRKRIIYKNVFTIDDEETVVLDDALSLEYDEDKNYIVNVHIADASYFVKAGSALDRAASERGRTFYINYEDDRAMFMLPDNICMEHGSLIPGKERLAVTTQFVFSKQDYSLLGQLSDVEVHRSIVCSLCRLTKEEAGRILLDDSMTQLKDMSTTMFIKMKRDLSIVGKIATERRKTQWPDSYLYEPDRGKQDKYTMAGSSLVEMFMCLCNTAIPAKLLKRDGRVGPVLVHTPIKPGKQNEWLERHHHLLKGCPYFKRMISIKDQKSNQEALIFNQDCWDTICDLTKRSDSNSLATYLCSLHNFPEMFVAYRQLCKSQNKSFYDVITNQAQAAEYKHSHFNKIYTHFTSPLRRYCDLLVHRAVLGETSLPTTSYEIRQLVHTMNIHKWDEREFSRLRNMLCVTKCCIKEAKAIDVTVYVGKVSNKLMELHALPEHQDFLPDRICEVKLSQLQAEGDKKDKHPMIMKWQIEIIPAPGKELLKEDDNIEKCFNATEIPLVKFENLIQAVHHESFEEAKELIKSCKTENLILSDVKQEKVQHSRSLTITKWIREYSKLDIQLSSTQINSYTIEPTVSLIHISQTFSCCLLHVKHSIECYAPDILKYFPPNLFASRNMSHYTKLWWPSVTAESINSSISSKRIPVIIKKLSLDWTSKNEAQFIIPDYNDYRIRFQEPFSIYDYVCIQYHDLLPHPVSEDFELDHNKKITWVAHGRIVHELHGQIKIAFPKNISPPTVIFPGKTTLVSCDLEVIPLQVTFR